MPHIFKSILIKSVFFWFLVFSMSSLASTHLMTFLVSPNGLQIYTIGNEESNGSKTLFIIDISTGNVTKKMPLPLVKAFSWFKPNLAITPDEKKLYIVDIDKKFYLVDVLSEKVTRIKNKPKQDTGTEVSSPMTLTPDGKRLYIADGVAQLHSPAVIHIVDTMTDNILTTIPGTGWWSGSSVLDSNLGRLYIARQLNYYHGEVSVLDTRTQLLEKSPIKVNDHLEAIAVNSNDGMLYVASQSSVDVINPLTGKYVDTILHSPAGRLSSLSFAPNGNKLYVLNDTGGKDSGIIVFDVTTRKILHLPLAIYHTDSEIRFSADGKKIYVNAGFKNTIYIIDANLDKVIQEMDLSLKNFFREKTS